MRNPEIVAHPGGGWTLAVPVPNSNRRVYVGNWDTKEDVEHILGVFIQYQDETEHWSTVEAGELVKRIRKSVQGGKG